MTTKELREELLFATILISLGIFVALYFSIQATKAKQLEKRLQQKLKQEYPLEQQLRTPIGFI